MVRELSEEPESRNLGKSLPDEGTHKGSGQECVRETVREVGCRGQGSADTGTRGL